MQEILLLKCGELVLKGLNRHRFEQQLMSTLRRRLGVLGDYDVRGSQSAIYVTPLSGSPIEPALAASLKVFGIVSVQRAAVCDKNMEDITETAGEYLRNIMQSAQSFKVEARRSDKSFPLGSPQISAEVGGFLHDLYPTCKPRMDGPEVTIKVEIRERNAFISGERLPGAGGMPTGSNGRAMLLLSGGIDSPVAGWMMAKRGLELSAIHFFSHPYTSEDAKQKVLDLAKILTEWCGRMTVNVAHFTKIQLEIQQKCHEEYATILMRRFMMRIADRVAADSRCKGLITGESLGQVASQTIESLAATDAVCGMPVFRPVIGMDKEEIVTISRKINTYETSILPFEDCCTVFTPRHPQTKPKIENIERQESRLDVESLVTEAVQGIEYITIR